MNGKIDNKMNEKITIGNYWWWWTMKERLVHR